jgi:hypothetical protein
LVFLAGSFSLDASIVTAASPTFKRADTEKNARLFARKGRPPSQKSALRSTPVVVHDLRIRATPAYTRLVLDLHGTPTFTQRQQKNPDRVTIELQNSVLGKPALE